MFVEERGRVEYDTVDFTECAEPDCSARHQYGVEAREIEENVLLGVITLDREERSKQYCPKHSGDANRSQKARRKEHEQARDHWRSMKEQRQQEEFEEIVNSELLPSFQYSREELEGPDAQRFNANIESFEEAMEFLQAASLPTPVLIYSTYPHRYAVVTPDAGVAEDWEVAPNSDIDSERFKHEYDDVQYVNRDFYDVRTNELTGTDCHTPVRKINEYVDEVVEWNEYHELQGTLRPRYCPVCSDTGVYERKMNFSRVIIDGEETILVSHTRSRCESIMGELNGDFVDRDAYDFRPGE